jgi:RNA polymerase sigma-70 factor (ECF subfamily)
LRYLGAAAADAEDLTQETFLAVARAEFTEHTPQQTASYLRTVARNQLLSFRRRKGNAVETVDLAAAEAVWAATFESETPDGYLGWLDECLEHVEGRARRVLDLFYRDGAGREAIAAELEMQVDGVKTLLRRTRDALRHCIERKRQTSASPKCDALEQDGLVT